MDGYSASSRHYNDGDSSSSPLTELSSSPECPEGFELPALASVDRCEPSRESVTLESIDVAGSDIIAGDTADESIEEHTEEEHADEPIESSPEPSPEPVKTPATEPAKEQVNIAAEGPPEESPEGPPEEPSKEPPEEPPEEPTKFPEPPQAKPETESAERVPGGPVVKPTNETAKNTEKSPGDILVKAETAKPAEKPIEAVATAENGPKIPLGLRLPPLRDGHKQSFTSSLSALTDHSELSSMPSSASSKATTPVDEAVNALRPIQQPVQLIPEAPILPRAPAPAPAPALAAGPVPSPVPVLAPAPVTTSTTAPIPAPSRTPVPVPSLPDLPPSGPASPQPARQSTPKQLSLTQSPTPQTPPSHRATFPSSPLKPNSSKRTLHKVRPKSSIPHDVSTPEYARQCVAAAESSRLNPYALHEEEHILLRQHLTHAQITTYLNIRNGILRLWMRKPHLSVTRRAAIGCARDSRWFDVASVCFDWLCRRGYINFGCVEIREPRGKSKPVGEAGQDDAPTGRRRRKRIIVIGAGMAGLGCARQLDGLFQQYADQFEARGEEPPEIIVLEGRDRIGGRVYSRPFQAQPERRTFPPGFDLSRATGEMGGMIITGFDRGNPMNILLRGQLGLGYHALRSETTIYDTNGKPVDPVRDGLVENLFNECLDRVSEYKFKLPMPKAVEGNRDLMNEGRDASSSEGGKTIAAIEDTTAATAALAAATKTSAAASSSPSTSTPRQQPSVAQSNETPVPTDLVPVSSDRLTGRAVLEPGTLGTVKAACKLRLMGWDLKPGVTESRDLDLDPPAETAGATLGYVVEEAIKQYTDLIDLNAQDFRLLNWHIANLEYSNAINHTCLSLQGWDIDAGNEWEGKHSMVIGGYQSVPRGLMLCPTPLRVNLRKVVTKISYNLGREDGDASGDSGDNGDSKPSVAVECENGERFEADYVVNTIPLGVLKHGDVEFEPPLPTWKTDTIRRLGYGVLNKILLTYRQPFWDPSRDIFGVLRKPSNGLSLDQADYAQRRGRMFQWLNVTKSTGIPCLVALMAGDAAYDTETSSNDELVAEATAVLRSVFGAEKVPEPVEAVVTRWRADKFARGSYSSAGPDMKIDDYDTMARPVGAHLLFAGEHTTGTHPATVHGAYLTGLRVASDVFEALLGPIAVPTPLVIPKELALSLKRKAALEEEYGIASASTPAASAAAAATLAAGTGDESSSTGGGGGSLSGSRHRDAKANLRRRREARERLIEEYICAQIGNRPLQPARVVDTSYLLFSKANYDRARAKCEEGRRPGKGRPLPNEVRVLTSKMWRSASAEERRPFAEQAAREKQAYMAALDLFNEAAGTWDRQAAELRAAYEKAHPSSISSSNNNSNSNSNSNGMTDHGLRSPSASGSAAASPRSGRRLRQMTSYHADGESDVDMTG